MSVLPGQRPVVLFVAFAASAAAESRALSIHPFFRGSSKFRALRRGLPHLNSKAIIMKRFGARFHFKNLRERP